MKHRPPLFWYLPGKTPAFIAAPVLSAVALIYQAGHYINCAMHKPYKPAVPVICVGNLVAGGSGKTPVALSLSRMIKDISIAANPYFLSRGYGGSKTGPVIVDPEKHSSRDVGDEALLLARDSETVIAQNRARGAKMAEEHGADIIIMDDGMQNPTIAKTVNITVINGAYGFGNGKTIPAGPLREKLEKGFHRSDAFVLIGADETGVLDILPEGKPVFAAGLEPDASHMPDKNKSYTAFCGIAHPQRFMDTLATHGYDIKNWHPYPDHYQFTDRDLDQIASAGMPLITTEKDYVRLPTNFTEQNEIYVLPVAIKWDNQDAIVNFLKSALP